MFLRETLGDNLCNFSSLVAKATRLLIGVIAGALEVPQELGSPEAQPPAVLSRPVVGQAVLWEPFEVQPALAVLLGLLALPEPLVVKVVPEFEHLVRVSFEPPVSEPVAASPPAEPPEERLVVELLPFEVPVERAQELVVVQPEHLPASEH